MNLASNLNQIIDDMQGGIRNFSQHGVCSNCGSCCGNILPVSKSEIKKIRKYITRHNITAQVRTALCLSIRNCIKRAPKSTVPGQHRFGFEKPRFCSL